VVTAISLGSLIASLLLVAWQTNSLSRQTRLQTQTAVATSGDIALTMLQTVMLRLLDQPQLFPYIYEGRQPTNDPQLRLLAEALADAVNYGCEVGRELPIAASRVEGFADYGVFLLENSPIIRRLIEEHPSWWPELANLSPSQEAGS